MTWKHCFCCETSDKKLVDDGVVAVSCHIEEKQPVQSDTFHKAEDVTLNQSAGTSTDYPLGRLSENKRNGHQYFKYQKVDNRNCNDQNEHLGVKGLNRYMNTSRNEVNKSCNESKTLCINDNNSSIGHDKLSQEDVFLHDFLSTLYVEVKLDWSSSELYIIRTAVEDLVSYLLNRLEQIEPNLKIGEIIPTGSCYDGTKILQPDEYDYLAVIDFLSSDSTTAVASGESCSAYGYAHVLCDVRSKYLSRAIESDDGNCVTASQRPNSFREYFRGHFHAVLLQEIDNAYSLEKPTGVLQVEGFSVSINGPQCNVRVVWTPNNDSNILHIDIDISPVIKCSFGHVIDNSEVLNDDIFKVMSQYQYFFLIPRPQRTCVKCFKMVFPHCDQHLMKTLSEAHMKVLLILKQLAYQMLRFDFRLKSIFNSFSMKMALLHHSMLCKETEGQNVSDCLKRTFQYIKEHLDKKVPELTSVFTIRRNICKTAADGEISLARALVRNVAAVFNHIDSGKFKDCNYVKIKRELLFACSNTVPLDT